MTIPTTDMDYVDTSPMEMLATFLTIPSTLIDTVFLPGPVDPSVATFFVDSITPGVNTIILVLNKDILISSVLPASYWSITGGTIPIVISSVSASGAEITLTVNEGKAGEALTVHVPYNSIIADDESLFDGPLAIEYTSVAQSPVLVQAQVIDNTHVRVIYSEPVQSASATVLANYSINNGLGVISVVQENERNYIVETTTQVPSTTYLVTVTGVLDLNGNPV